MQDVRELSFSWNGMVASEFESVSGTASNLQLFYSLVFLMFPHLHMLMCQAHTLFLLKRCYISQFLLLLLKHRSCNFFPEGNLMHRKSTISLYVAWKFIRTDKILSMYPYIYNNVIRCSVRLARTRPTALTGLLCSFLRGHKPSLTCDLSFFTRVPFYEVK